MPCANFRSEDGSAVLEFIGFGLLLQIPMLVLVTNLVSHQHDQLAAEAISREALRSYVLLNKEPAKTALELAEEYRISPERIRVTMSCERDECNEEGAWIFLRTQVGEAVASGVSQR